MVYPQGKIGESTANGPKFDEWRGAATLLADTRENELPRTVLVIAIYIFGVLMSMAGDTAAVTRREDVLRQGPRDDKYEDESSSTIENDNCSQPARCLDLHTYQ